MAVDRRVGSVMMEDLSITTLSLTGHLCVR